MARELPDMGVFADDPLHLIMRVNGADLTSASLRYVVQATPFSLPLITLDNVTTAGATGVRVVETGTESGLPYSDLEIFAAQETLTAALSAFPGGGELRLYHKFQWTLAEGGVWTLADQTVFFGALVIFGGSNG